MLDRQQAGKQSELASRLLCFTAQVTAAKRPCPAAPSPCLLQVELNAVALAWDTVVRFSSCGLPEAFFADFAR